MASDPVRRRKRLGAPEGWPAVRALAILAVLSLVPPVAAGALPFDDDHAVPEAAAAMALFPSHEDVLAEVRALDAEPRVVVLDAGASEEGRTVPLVVVADPPVGSPADVGDRVVTLLYTQQHGNEPAGTPAALAMLKALAGSYGDEVLADQVVLVLPMVNPDGATAGTRENVDGSDTNRDHMNVTSATARLVHAVVDAWDPVLAVDHHEYGGTGPGTGPVYFYDWDATILWPKHANVDPEVVDLSRAVDEAMRAKLAEHGHTSGDYGKLTLNGVPLYDLAGGPTPNIARNHYGMHHAASLLVESRVDVDALTGLPTNGDADRRVEVHVLTMEAALEYVATHAEEARRVQQGSRTRALAADLAFDGGAPVDFPRWGYGGLDASTRDTLAVHGLDLVPEGVPVAQPLRAHAGLLLDPASTWRLAEGERLDAGPVVAATSAPAEVPALGVLATLGIALVARRR